MKTISLIAVSTLLGSAVSGQMIAPQKADTGSDFQPPNPQEFPGPRFPTPPTNETVPLGLPEPNRQPPPNGLGVVPPPPVVHVTKTKTQIIYPPPNEWRWKNLPSLPYHKHHGKIVAEFYVDEKGRYREIKHGRRHGSRYSNSWNQDDYNKLAIDGHHPHGKAIYGGPWTGPGISSHKGGYKYKGGHEDGGRQDYHHHQHGKDMHEEYRKGDYHDHHRDDDYHDDKKKDHHENNYNNNNKKHEKDPHASKNKNDWKKKTAEGYQAKGIEGIVAQNNTAAVPIDNMVASGSASAVEGAVSASMPASASGAATAPAQKTPHAAGSASSMAAAASAKNAAASSSAHPSGASAKPSASNSMSTSATSAAANTRQVALSVVAAVAATAVWCLA